MYGLEVSGIVSFILGIVTPWIAEKFKGTFLKDNRFTVIATGFIGVIVAFLSDYILVQLGLATPQATGDLAMMGFGLSSSASTLSYMTFIKEKK